MFLHPPKASKSAYNLRNPYTHVKVYIQLKSMHLVVVITRMPGKSYYRWLRSLLLRLCDVFQELTDSIVGSNLCTI